MNSEKQVAVVGLGYVGLPLALAFGKKLKTIGYDLSQFKVSAYQQGTDPTGEMPTTSFEQAKKITYTTNPEDLKNADYIVVAVPTPIDDAKRPDLTPVVLSSQAVGKYMKKGCIVIYESTVYPGVTEDICGPILEKESGMVCGKDFWLGYSPERINPGDKEHTLERIVKVVSGQDDKTLKEVAWLYSQVIEAGVYEASSIKVAEAAKVIENTQRDLNIALMNELSIIFHKLNIDTVEVLKAAGTKWNFLPFRPGLVGGHCIGVDPYYLTHKAEMLGYHPQVILAGRRINDSMGAYIAGETIKKLIESGKNPKGAVIAVLGITFKENVSDLRNSKVIDVIRELESFGVDVKVWDPVAEAKEAKHEYGVDLVDLYSLKQIDGIVAAVSHKQVLDMDFDRLKKSLKTPAPFIDVKSAFNPKKLKELNLNVWRL